MVRAILPLLVSLSILAAPRQGKNRPIVIYLHGRIVEEQGPAAVSPTFGPYRYQAILDSLRASGFEVLAALRPAGTDLDAYGDTVVAQVDSLLRAGVTPSRIAVIGFSKGGGIAIRASAALGRTDLSFVLLAACGGGAGDLRVAGRILSVVETSDSSGPSCAPLFANAAPGTVHREQRITTGRGHGAFYRPVAAWLGPVRAWIRRRSS